MVCPECSKPIKEGAEFCSFCGAQTKKPIEKDSLIGQTLLDQYVIQKKLGEGGFGAVYLADQPSVGRKAAVKTLHRHLAFDEQMVKRFRREGLAASRLQHPCAVKIYNSGQTKEGLLWIAMEFIEGQTLDDRIVKHGPLLPEELIDIFEPICEVLHEAHEQGIIHRDLKPENIMLTSLAGGKVVPKLLDFGIAGLLNDKRVTQTGLVSGTPPYMSPEQWKGLTHVDRRSDIYALGIIAFQALSGKLPFEAETGPSWMYAHCFTEPLSLEEAIKDRNITFPPMFESILRKTLAKAPDARYQTTLSFYQSLRDAKEAKSFEETSGFHTRNPAPNPTKTPRIKSEAPTVPAVVSGVPPTVASLEVRQTAANTLEVPERGKETSSSPIEMRAPLSWKFLLISVFSAVGLTLGILYLFGVFSEAPLTPASLPRVTTTIAESPVSTPSSTITAPVISSTIPVEEIANNKLSEEAEQTNEIKQPVRSKTCPKGARLQKGKCVCTRSKEVFSEKEERCLPIASVKEKPLEEIVPPKEEANNTFDETTYLKTVKTIRAKVKSGCVQFASDQETTVRFTIKPTGDTEKIRTESKALSACAAAIVKNTKFPSFSGEEIPKSVLFSIE